MKKSNAGFSLIELMVTVGIFGVMSAGVASLIVHMNEQVQKATGKNNLVSLGQEIRTLLADTDKCTGLLKGTTLKLNESVDIEVGLDVTDEIVRADSKLPKRGLRITKFALDAPTIGGTSGANRLATTNARIDAGLIGSADRTGKNEFQDFQRITAASLSIIMDPANAIVECRAIGGGGGGGTTDVAVLCVDMGGTWANNKCEFTSSADKTCLLLGGSWANGKCQGLAGADGQNGNNGASCPNSLINQYPGIGRPDPTKSTPHGQSVGWTDGSAQCGSSATHYSHQCVSGVWISNVRTETSASCNPNCFTSVTQILMEDGSQKEIVELRPGDRVVSGLSNSVNTVLEVEAHKLGDRSLISLNGSDYFSTPEHPFLTLSGWKSVNPQATAWEGFKVVGPLQVGDVVKLRGEFVILTSIKSTHPARSEMVYNLVLTGDHTYIANGYTVHNKLQ